MKKAFGIVFLVVGVIMIAMGIAALTNVATKNETFGGRLRNEISDSYRSNNNEQKLAGIGLAGIGFVLFVTGIIMVATKSAAQRKKEADLLAMKKMQSQNVHMQQPNFSPNNFQQPKPTNFSQPDPGPAHTQQPNATAVAYSIEDKFSQIERLGKLREQGLLTEEEFQEQKRKVLG
ncbi:MAG: SHOCT domain-containing protein [Bacteroidota bacterium]|nr:SHOCT domain-containing protein [Bacteroidota bacterium]